jgi:hypothetical protein
VQITAASTLEDVCFAVCTALHRAGITAVLSGGSAATMYASAAYQSRDADFVVAVHGSGGANILTQLGYKPDRSGTYKHTENHYTVDFPGGPLAIGDDLITTWDTRRREDELLHILSRTDCIRDRLMWFYTSNDRSALAAAIGVAKSGEVDIDRVRDWSNRQGFGASFEVFVSRL